MKISAERLKEIIESHGKWLHDEKGGQRADLWGADLRGADLQRADLRGADLRGADLQRADLRGADLWGADLQRADLRGADLWGADLRGADLRGADLWGADLWGADLQRADLRGADLWGADLRGADLQRADLRGADLRGADLQRADLPDGIYQVVGCGSVNRCTTYDSINDRVICGCWNDNNDNHLAAFEQRIEDVYGINGEQPDTNLYSEYMAAVTFFKTVKGDLK